MKITSIKAVERGFPEEIALIEVKTDAGVTGISATAAWITAVSALIKKISDRVTPRLETLFLGEDPTEPARLWHTTIGSGAFGRACEGGLAVNAMSGSIWRSGTSLERLRGRQSIRSSVVRFRRNHGVRGHKRIRPPHRARAASETLNRQDDAGVPNLL